MIETYNYTDLNHYEKHIIAGIVSAYSNLLNEEVLGTEGAALIPVELEDIAQSELALVSFVEDSFAGFIRAKKVRTHNDLLLREVGSLMVLKKFRGSGIGSNLVRTMTDMVTTQAQVPYAFCGPDSEGIFVKAGYQYVKAGQLPLDAVSQKGNQAMIYTKSQTEGLMSDR